MPKLLKSKMFLFTLFVVVVGSVYSIKEQIRIRELRQYVQWRPRPVIKDYEFIHNGEALVIEWDDGDERELIEEVNNGKPQFAYQLNTPNGASGERYIMQESYKLKAVSYTHLMSWSTMLGMGSLKSLIAFLTSRCERCLRSTPLH